MTEYQYRNSTTQIGDNDDTWEVFSTDEEGNEVTLAVCLSEGIAQALLLALEDDSDHTLQIRVRNLVEAASGKNQDGSPDMIAAYQAALDEFSFALPQYGVDMGGVSDGHHTFDELYEFRKLYNAGLFGLLAAVVGNNYVVKSKYHSDGEECFGGGWFIVVAELPTGQISNHYKLEDWDLFKIPAVERPPEYDGHTSKDTVERLKKWLTQ
jgi:hypothetical protein